MSGNRIPRALSVACVMIMVVASLSMLAGAKEEDKKITVIVTFKEKVDEKLIKDSGGEVLTAYSIFPGVVTELTESAIKELRKNDKVEAVEEDGEAEALEDASDEKKPGGGPPDPPAQSIPWGIEKIGCEDAWLESTGTGTKVAVVDTGIDKDHADLQANIAGGVNFVPRAGKVDSTAWDDDNGHGTHCAGIIAAVNNEIGVVGAAYDVDLYAVKVLDKTGSGRWSWIISGIDWAASNGMQVISMSLGGIPSGNDFTALKAACDGAKGKNCVLVAASGNSGGGIIYPAAYDSVIAVGATDSLNARASWSCHGPQLDLVAPGVSIYSTYKGGGYKTLSGTSMACPHVSGAAALVLATPVGGWDDNDNDKWDPDEVQTCLQSTATDLGASGPDEYFGSGLVNAYKAVGGI